MVEGEAHVKIWERLQLVAPCPVQAVKLWIIDAILFVFGREICILALYDFRCSVE